MIKQFNPNKLCKQNFFIDLVNYLYLNQAVTLREIKSAFSSQANIDKSIEEFIKAGYIERSEKRYRLLIQPVTDVSTITLDQHFFIEADSPAYKDLLNLSFNTEVKNSTNDVIIQEATNILRDTLTISNYFYKLRENLPLSEEQTRLYDILGDVNPEYFLKHVTTFLLKYVRKEFALQKRKNIFVDALVVLGYLIQVEDGRYILNMELDTEGLIFSAKKD